MLLWHKPVTSIQRCKRRYALENEWKVRRWHVKDLFHKVWREAIIGISNGADAAQAADEACTKFLEACADPGIDTLADPYILARDFCAILSTSLEAVSRMVLLSMKLPDKCAVGEHIWQPMAMADESGNLHLWIAVERWDIDTKFRVLHSWEVFGDCCAARSGMSLHVIEIGRQSKGHQHTPWARVFAHPSLHNIHKFQKQDGGRLEQSWKTKWYQDSDRNNAKDWVDMMLTDNVAMFHHLEVKEPSEETFRQFRIDMAYESGKMMEALRNTYLNYPMERPQCDLPPCPFQEVCYAPGLVNIEAIGLYERRK